MTGSTSASACRATCRTCSSSRRCASRVREVRERCTVQRAALAARAGRGRALPRRRGRRARGGGAARRGCRRHGARRSRRSSAPGGPTALSRNGRGLVFRYMDDPRARRASRRETYQQWREGDSFAFAFPTTPAGRLLVLMMGHRDEASEARRDPEGYWRAQAARASRAARADGGRRAGSKLRSTGETPAFFRASSGPGWALAGDAGHFKDPVTGQGMRDAMFAGRTLAERLLPALDDPARGGPRDAPVGGRARPRVPARLPLRQRGHARRAPVAGAARARARCRAQRRAPTSATSSDGRARPARSRPRRASRARCALLSGAASARARRRSRRPPTRARRCCAVERERRADRFRSSRAGGGLRAPGRSAGPAAPARRGRPARTTCRGRPG